MVTSTVTLYCYPPFQSLLPRIVPNSTLNLTIFLTLQPKQEARLGSQGSQSVTSHPFFEAFGWDQLERGKLAVRSSRSLIFLHRNRRTQIAVLDNINSGGMQKSEHGKIENELLRYHLHPVVVAPRWEIPPDPNLCQTNLCLAFVLPPQLHKVCVTRRPSYAVIPMMHTIQHLHGNAMAMPWAVIPVPWHRHGGSMALPPAME